MNEQIDPKEYPYLYYLYCQIADYIENDDRDAAKLGHVIVSICIVTEKLIKIVLYRENKILAYKIKELDERKLVDILKGKGDDYNTASVSIAAARLVQLLGPSSSFSENHLEFLTHLVGIRNKLVHGFQPISEILEDQEGINNKIDVVWSAVSQIGSGLFDSIVLPKLEKKFTEADLNTLLEDEVRRMIKQPNVSKSMSVYMFHPVRTSVFLNNEKCPRCGSRDFKQDADDLSNPYAFMWENGYMHGDGLYKCKNCNLELTEKQFEIAKKINVENVSESSNPYSADRY